VHTKAMTSAASQYVHGPPGPRDIKMCITWAPRGINPLKSRKRLVQNCCTRVYHKSTGFPVPTDVFMRIRALSVLLTPLPRQWPTRPITTGLNARLSRDFVKPTPNYTSVLWDWRQTRRAVCYCWIIGQHLTQPRAHASAPAGVTNDVPAEARGDQWAFNPPVALGSFWPD